MNAELTAAVADVRAAAEWLRGPYLAQEIVAAAERAAVHAASPWMDRATAAAYCHCSASEIDRAANAGVFKRYLRAGTPLFKREEIDGAIASGRWVKRSASVGTGKGAP